MKNYMALLTPEDYEKILKSAKTETIGQHIDILSKLSREDMEDIFGYTQIKYLRQIREAEERVAKIKRPPSPQKLIFGGELIWKAERYKK